jgi:hypothetical protein
MLVSRHGCFAPGKEPLSAPQSWAGGGGGEKNPYLRKES